MVCLICLDGQVFKLLMGKIREGRGSCTCSCIFTLFFKCSYPFHNGGICGLFIVQFIMERNVLHLQLFKLVLGCLYKINNMSLMFPFSPFQLLLKLAYLFLSFIKLPINVLTTSRFSPVNAPNIVIVSTTST